MSVRMSPEHATGVLFENFTVLSLFVPNRYWLFPRNLRLPKVPPNFTGSVRPAAGIGVHTPLPTEYSKPGKLDAYCNDLTNVNPCSLSAVNVTYSVPSSSLHASFFPDIVVFCQSVTETCVMVRALWPMVSEKLYCLPFSMAAMLCGRATLSCSPSARVMAMSDDAGEAVGVTIASMVFAVVLK